MSGLKILKLAFIMLLVDMLRMVIKKIHTHTPKK